MPATHDDTHIPTTHRGANYPFWMNGNNHAVSKGRKGNSEGEKRRTRKTESKHGKNEMLAKETLNKTPSKE